MAATEKSDVVIVGGVAAGPKTAATLARRRPELKVTLFERGEFISYGTCGMPYFASGDIGEFAELTRTSWGAERSPEFFRRAKGFEVVTGAEVMAIDRERKCVTVRRVDSGETFEHAYDKLVFATGSNPNAAPFPTSDSPNVRHFTRPADALGFRRLAETGKVGEAVIIGAGFIGCELAEATGGLWGIGTTIIERENQVLPYVLDPEMGALVQDELVRQDVTVITGATVKEVRADENGSVTTVYAGGNGSSGEELTAGGDYVFLSVGVSPEVSLARACGLEIGSTGGIKVNEQMQTSDLDIFAGGDCVESVNRITGREMYLPMGSLANRHGRVIAETIVGNPARFPGVVGAFLVKVYDINAGSVGLSEHAARRAGLAHRAVWGSFPDKPDYYPEYASIVVKMVYDPGDHRLLGLQAVGKGDICRRIDVFSTYLQRGARVEDLLEHEHGYAPPYAEALDPLFHLAAVAQAQEKGIDIVNPGSLASLEAGQALILDVRQPDEIKAKPLFGDDDSQSAEVLAIPLEDLSDRLNDLDRGKNIYIVCRRGPRSYQATIILRAAGFENVHVIGGGTTAQTGKERS